MRFRGLLVVVLLVAVAPVLTVALAQSLVEVVVDAVVLLLDAAQSGSGVGG